jgi:hypothetical protein
VADRDTEVLIVAKNDIAPLLQQNPQLPERLGAMLTERQEMNQAVLSSQRTVGTDEQDDVQRSLVSRIRSFFGIS